MAALFRCSSGSGGGGTDMSSLKGKVLITSTTVANYERFFGIIKGLKTISLVWNPSTNLTLSVYGYVGSSGTLITTLSKSSSAQTVTVTGYERLSLKGSNSGTVTDITAVS